MPRFPFILSLLLFPLASSPLIKIFLPQCPSSLILSVTLDITLIGKDIRPYNSDQAAEKRAREEETRTLGNPLTFSTKQEEILLADRAQ